MSSRLRETIAVNIRRLRAEHRWSQEGLADQCGLHRTYIGAIERGEHNVTLETLERIASALGVAVTDLLREAPRKKGRTR